MDFTGPEEEGLALDDWSTDRPPELVANQVVSNPFAAREKVVRGKSLDAVVLKHRTVPLVGSTLEYGIGNKAASLAVFSRVCIGDDAIFLNGIGRNAGGRAALIIPADLAAPRLSLFVVVHSLDQVAASTLTGSVHGSTPVVTCVILGYGAWHQLDKGVLVANFEGHLLPDTPVDQVRD